MEGPVTGVRVWLYDDRSSLRHAVQVRFSEVGGTDGDPAGDGDPAEENDSADDSSSADSCNEVCAFDVATAPGYQVCLCALDEIDMNLLVTVGRFSRDWEADAAAVAVSGLAKSADDWVEDGAFPAARFALACMRLGSVRPERVGGLGAAAAAEAERAVSSLMAAAAAKAAHALVRDVGWRGALRRADGVVVLVLNSERGLGWGAFAEDWLRRPPLH